MTVVGTPLQPEIVTRIVEGFDFSFSRYRFWIEAKDQLGTLTYWGHVLRRHWINNWKPEVCEARQTTEKAMCSYGQCLKKTACPFAQVFETTQAAEKIQRPYALLPDIRMEGVIYPGTLATFDLLLVGKTQGYINTICQAFSRGTIQLNDAWGRYWLRMVTSVDLDGGDIAIVYTPKHPDGARTGTQYSWHDVRRWAAERLGETEQVTLNFLPFLRLRRGDHSSSQRKVLVSPRIFSEVLRQALNTISDLAHFCDQPELDKDFIKQLIMLSKETEVEWDGLQLDSIYRNSRNQEKRTDSPIDSPKKKRSSYRIEGYWGPVSYQGRLAPFLPWLALGQYLQIGNLRVEGMGAYRMQRS